MSSVPSWALVGLIGLVVVDTHSFFRSFCKSEQLNDEVMRVYVNAVLMLGILIWPLVWDVAVASPQLSGLQRLQQNPKMALGLVWPLVMIVVDMQYVRQRAQDASFFESLHRIGYLQTDANTIITAAFAMGTLITSMRQKQDSSGSGMQIVMYALLLCVAFVIPTSDVPVTSRAALIIRSAQKVCLNYAIGFVIAGIMADLI
jgi:hypothetical protein